MRTNWECPYHKEQLKNIPGCPGALTHPGCSEVFTVMSNRLYVVTRDHQHLAEWKDAETGELVRLGKMDNGMWELSYLDMEGKVVRTILLVEEVKQTKD